MKQSLDDFLKGDIGLGNMYVGGKGFFEKMTKFNKNIAVTKVVQET